jgi:hypothetical protein
MDQVTANPEVMQLVGDVNRVTRASEKLVQTAQLLPRTVRTERQAAIKQITDWLDQERQNLMADLEARGPQVKGMVTETRQALLAGNDLVKSVHALYARLRADTPKDKEVTPIDYVKTLEKASEAAHHFRELVLVMDAFVAGEEAAERPAAFIKAMNEVNNQSKALLNHAFLLATGLILLFLVGLVLALLRYRYFAGRLLESSRERR